ncbi:Nitroreductase [Duganella sp. CF517]|uniref:nitroreductase n=1 Tax=Duganella sp. CF517 TaxID=1881038 RepID=UPI0008C3B4A6|nr:nitroreductase [Duganella sp. CF517]SEO16754.1 Nitroreductase [Duganella sp. CF517]
MISTPEQQAVDAAITSRRSIRAYLPQAVARDDILTILRVAGRAPSGTNTQPWKVYVLEGERKQELSSAILAIYNDPEQARLHTEEYAYYPSEWVSPYIDRRRKVGWDLYALLGLTRDNKAGMAAQHGRNYEFFGAPVGLIFTIDRVMEQGSWLDYGMFLQSVMVAARGRGLDTCPQAAFTQYHRVIASVLNIPDNETVVCGMSLGYADMTKIENSLITERMPVEEFVKFVVKD